MDSLKLLLLAPGLSLAMGLIVLIGFPWLLIPFLTPLLLMQTPVRVVKQKRTLPQILRLSRSQSLWITYGVFVALAMFVPLVARVAGEMFGRSRALDFDGYMNQLATGSGFCTFMAISMYVVLRATLLYRSLKTRHVMLVLCGAASLGVGFAGMYSLVGSRDGQVGIAVAALPMYCHLAASVVLLFFVAPAWWRYRKWVRDGGRPFPIGQSEDSVSGPGVPF